LKLTLKALPDFVNELNCHRCELFNFMNTQSALIGYKNVETDSLFKFYDERNKNRLNKLLKKANVTKGLTEKLKDMGETMN